MGQWIMSRNIIFVQISGSLQYWILAESVKRFIGIMEKSTSGLIMNQDTKEFSLLEYNTLVHWKSTDVFEEHVASIFRVKQ
jgi:hypothetical protein